MNWDRWPVAAGIALAVVLVILFPLKIMALLALVAVAAYLHERYLDD